MPADRPGEPVRYLVFPASLHRGSLNAKLADLAAAAIKANGGEVAVASMRDFEASTHYPCVKRAWVEYLGEHPEPALDRVE